jgi:hypothetical protein
MIRGGGEEFRTGVHQHDPAIIAGIEGEDELGSTPPAAEPMPKTVEQGDEAVGGSVVCRDADDISAAEVGEPRNSEVVVMCVRAHDSQPSGVLPDSRRPSSE